MLSRFRQWLNPDLAIDLGSTNVRLALAGGGVLVDEPAVVALQKGTRKVLGQGTAVGKLARQMLGRTPDTITAVRPIRGGVITDFELCEALLRYLLEKARRHAPGLRPRIVIGVPGSITPVERRAVFNSLERCGAGQVFLVPAAKAAAIGGGLPISEPLANLVCNIGGGTTEIAVLSLAEIVAHKSLRIAGDEFDQAIVDYLKLRYSLRIGLQTAEQIKTQVGSAYPLPQELTYEVRGLDIISSVPRKAVITSEEVREALAGPLTAVLNGIKSVIEHCHPELVADLTDTGMVLCGGAAGLPGLDLFFQEQLGIPARRTADPARTVIQGLTICLEHLASWKGQMEAA
jgi:rod shape-determining protein MreB